ncbi:MAG: C10 family peptidase [Bacteroidales bacterium]|nr:C10 family peptidase [Bacteroidales bacterium]
MFRRYLIISALLLALPLMVSAAPVTRSQAQEVARQFMNKKGMSSQIAEMAYKSPRRGQVSEEDAYYFVFNAPNKQGFVVVSGDDRTAEVLGYAYRGSFDETQLPQHVKAFLQTYADEIQYLEDAGITEVQRAPRRAGEEDYQAIAPLICTRWDQGSPYNALCPNNCPTGCAATSTAQVMNYHKWPAATTAEIPSYRTGSRNFYLEAVPEGTVFNWDAMLDTYNHTSSSESRQAVAELMSYVGRGIKMDYDFMGSGAYSSDMGPALNNYFDYQVTQLYRKNYPLVAFEDSIYQQLAMGYPVIFNGMSTGGGHSFVVDGYDSNHFFHVNWGWGGQDDNYFLLSVLNPYNNTSIGSSSSEDGFSYDQDVLFLKPGLQTPLVNKPLEMNIVGVTEQGVLVEYYSLVTGTKEYELGLGEVIDGDMSPLDKTLHKEKIRQFWGEEDMEFRVSGVDAGLHRLVPISRMEGDSTWRYDLYPYAEVMVGEDGSLEFNTVWNKMQTVNYEFEGSLFIGQTQPFKVTFLNDTDQEYYGPIYLFSNRGEGKTPNMRYSSFEGFTVPAHDSLRVSFSFRPSSSGKWTVSFGSDPSGKCIFGSCTVGINSGDVVIDGLRFKLNPETQEAKLVGGSEDYAGHIVIPDTIVSNGRNYVVTSLDNNVFNGCADVLSVTLPATLTSIGEYCFEDCKGLTAIHLPAFVKAIGQGAFAGCNNLVDIQVDENNAKYSAHDGMLFSNEGKTLNTYPSAQGVVNNLPDSLKVIGDGSLAGTSITRLILPASVVTMGMSCLSGCDELTTIVSKARKNPSCFSGVSSGTFAGLKVNQIQLIIPVGTEAVYSKADGWSKFTQVNSFKAFGAHCVQGFSSSRNIDLDGIVVVDDNFEEIEAATPKAYKVVYSDDEEPKLYASIVQGVVEAGNGLLVEGESTLVFKASNDPVSADVTGNLLMAALADTDLSTISNAYTYQDGTFVANSTDVVEAGGAYLVLEGVAAPSLPLYFGEIPGGISTISVDASEYVLYDLQGRRVKASESGFYILNGRKVLR